MSLRLLVLVTFCIICMVCFLFFLTRARFIEDPQNSTSRLPHHSVRGSSIFYKQKPYTLNFNQQNTLITILNHSKVIDRQKEVSYTPCSFEKITLYRFDELSDLFIEPIGFLQDELVFRVPEWDTTRDFKENSEGTFKSFLSNIYDL